jgi:hypothetical protein
MTANVPRLDYLGSSCPSLLLEPQRTNLALFSEQINNTSVYAIQESAVTPNAITSPDGTTNADLWYPTTSSNTGSCRLLQTIVAPSFGVSYTASIFVKRNNKRWLYFSAPDASSANHNAFFDIQNGVVGSIGSSVTNASIQDYGNGWYLCSVTSTATSTTQYIFVSAANGNGDQSVTANGTDGFYFYGAQLEAGSYPTSYIPTLGTSVTRVADVASKTGISSLIGQTEGTVFIDVKVSNKDSDLFLFNLNVVNNIIIGIGSGNVRASIYANSVVYNFTAFLISNINLKIAVGYKSGDSVLYINGVLISTLTNTFAFSDLLNNVYINRSFIYGNNSNDYNTILVSKTRLSNTELAQITTL